MPTQSRDSIADPWGPRTQHDGTWATRVDERTLETPERWVQSACVLCSNGCALDVGVKDGRIVGVRGREGDRINGGRLGPKGLHGWEANASPDRLTTPLIRERGVLRAATWDEAMDLMVSRCRDVRTKYTSGALAIYNTGQLFLEENYTLSLIAHGGLRTLNMDGNTRLCTATAAAAMRESFGSDGQPASYSDIDVTDCILHAGHNIAETQTVLWSRVLDRRRSPRRPTLLVIDPRRTPTAQEADIHLAPRVGTNLALMNGLLALLIKRGWLDQDFIQNHTVGFDKLADKVAKYTPQVVEQFTGVPALLLEEAAEALGTAPTLVSTVLQGFYQSHQATASSCQVNNLHLIRGMIGRPGCGVLQMNGQPTSQNTRETGCNGEYPLFSNWDNPEHMADIARRWNIAPSAFPHWHEPTHAMEIFRQAELGSIRWLWIICTNPAVSAPELHRIRSILSKKDLFVIVQDAFLTETTEHADVVLPAAIWAEKTGTFTNADRTVHLSLKAVEPPGQARADLDIFLDFARRQDFRDKDGDPLIRWSNAEEAFEDWRRFSRGWLCDYSGLTYDKLRGSGIQWPCNDDHPDGTERLYTDHVFPTSADRCESWGHDLETGAAMTKEDYRAKDPAGRAILKAADYQPAAESPDDSYPFWLTTGRVVYHFHTRTKTARSLSLQQAAPDPFVQIHEDDAAALLVADGDLIEVESRRGSVRARARIGGILKGHVFIPFHYGSWDVDHQMPTAANELTVSAWDPISKQPTFKYAAVSVRKVQGLGGRISTGRAVHRLKATTDRILTRAHTERARLAEYLGLLTESHEQFRTACRQVSLHHATEVALQTSLETLSDLSRNAIVMLQPYADRYGRLHDPEPARLRRTLFPSLRPGSIGILRDLQDLCLMCQEGLVALSALNIAAQALGDTDFNRACEGIGEIHKRQDSWLKGQIKHRAAQALVVPI